MKIITNVIERIHRRFSPIRHDATKHTAELYYANIYLKVIEEQLSGHGTLKILDAGCGTGRILIPLAKKGHHLTGIDYHRDTIKVLAKNTREGGVEARLIDGDVKAEIKKIPDESFDAVLAIECLYVNRDMPEVFGELCRIVRKGGFIFASHRMRYYYILYCLEMGKIDEAYHISTNSDGLLSKGLHKVYYNWQTSDQLQKLYEQNGLKIVKKIPIGSYSGFSPDPIRHICDPGKLSQKERELLYKIEIEQTDPDTIFAARYLLIAAHKN